MKQILVATDGSENGRDALDEAVELAAAAGARLTIVYVRHAPLPMLGEPLYQRSLSAELRHANETVAIATGLATPRASRRRPRCSRAIRPSGSSSSRGCATST